MLKFEELFNNSDEFNIETRVIGESADNQIIISVYNEAEKTTKIKLYSINTKTSKNLMTFDNMFKDFVQADMSRDGRFIHLTDIIKIRNNISFQSVVYDLKKNKRSKKFKFEKIISGIFLSNHFEDNCEMLHFVGSRVTHVLVKSNDNQKKLQIDKIRGGFHLTNTIFWQFNKEECSLFAIYSTSSSSSNDHSYPMSTLPSSSIPTRSQSLTVRGFLNRFSKESQVMEGLQSQDYVLTEFHFTDNSNIKFNTNLPTDNINVVQNTSSVSAGPFHLSLNSKSIMPKNISLSPEVLGFKNSNKENLRYVKSNCIRSIYFFIAKFHSRVCFIQQIFESEGSSIKFSVSCFPKYFTRNYTVPGVSSMIPLSFYQINSILFVFVPNYFIYLIDFVSYPPNISLLPKIYSSTEKCSSFLTNLSMTPCSLYHFIDTSCKYCKILNVKIDFGLYDLFTPIMNRTSWDAFANICARVLQPSLLTEAIRILELIGDYNNAVTFIHDLFQYNMIKFKKYSRQINIKRNNSHSANANNLHNNQCLSTNMNNSNEINSSIQSNIPNDNDFRFKKLKIKSSLKSIVNQINEEYPSASNISRKQMFKKILSVLITEDKTSKINDLAKKVIQKLQLQNEFVMNIKLSYENWINLYHPSEYWKFIILFLIQSETYFNNFPAVQGLNMDLNNVMINLCSQTLQSFIQSKFSMFPDKYSEQQFFLKFQKSDDSNIQCDD